MFTPCDFASPYDGKRAEATPNTEMIHVPDVDLSLRNELHTYGAVRNLRDRRGDLYKLEMKSAAKEYAKTEIHKQSELSSDNFQ